MAAFRRRCGGFLVKKVRVLATLLAGLLAAGTSQADVFSLPSGETSLQFVFVGDAGNPNDPASGGLYGDVPYIVQHRQIQRHGCPVCAIPQFRCGRRHVRILQLDHGDAGEQSRESHGAARPAVTLTV